MPGGIDPTDRGTERTAERRTPLSRAKRIMVGGVIALLTGPVVFVVSFAAMAGIGLGADAPEAVVVVVAAGVLLGPLMAIGGIAAIVVGLVRTGWLRRKAASSD